MSRTPFSSEEKDPTCVLKMLSSLTKPKNHRIGLGLDFERGQGSYRSMTNTIGRRTDRIRQGAAVALRLQFDDSSGSEKPPDYSMKKRIMESDIEGMHFTPTSSAGKKIKLDSARCGNTSAPFPASPWEFRLMRADLLQARGQIEVLERRNKELHASKQEQLIILENESKSLRMQHETDVARIRELQDRMEIVNTRRYEYKEELAQLRLQVKSTNLESESVVRSLEKRVSELQDELRDSESNALKVAVAGQRREAELETRLASASEAVALHERHVNELVAELREARQEHARVEIVNQQLQESLMKIRNLESEKEEMKEAVALALSQRQKLLKFPELEKELTKLREDTARLRGLVQNKLFLEEQVTSLESRLACSEERDREFPRLQARVRSLEASLEEWVALAKSLGSGAHDPGSLRMRFEHLQQRELQLTADSADLKSRLKIAMASKSTIESELGSLKVQFEKQKGIQEQQTSFIHRQRKKLLLVTQERDYHRAQLDSYEKELTMTSNTAIQTSHQEQQRTHVAALEKALQGYRELVQKLEEDFAKEKEKKIERLAAPTDRILALETEADNLRRENQSLLRKQEELTLEVQYWTLQGNFNPVKTKILHFKNNPSAEAVAQRKDELFSLREECNRLRERVRVLSEGQVKEDVTLVVEEKIQATISKEVHDLQEEVKTHQVKIQRMTEAFKKTLNEFREVVYLVWGYRMDFKNGNEYHLSSMYAESPDDILVFQYKSESGEVKMMETAFSSTLQSLIELHLRRQDSIPVFLSAVTLDLFSQQTLLTVTQPTVTS